MGSPSPRMLLFHRCPFLSSNAITPPTLSLFFSSPRLSPPALPPPLPPYIADILPPITSFTGSNVRQCWCTVPTMVLDNALSSPHRRTQGALATPAFKKFAANDLSCSALFQRHRFLLTTLVLLTILCTIYLYFAVTLGSSESCSRLLGPERELCLLKNEKGTGKLRHF